MLYEEEAMNDDDVSKLSIKRKNPESKPNSEHVSKVSKTTPAYSSSQPEDSQVSTQDSGGDVTGSSQLEVQSVYSFSRVRSFLQETKGMRLVKVEEYFPDLQLFLDYVKFFSKKKCRMPWPAGVH